jgi:hypothetical protein
MKHKTYEREYYIVFHYSSKAFVHWLSDLDACFGHLAPIAFGREIVKVFGGRPTFGPGMLDSVTVTELQHCQKNSFKKQGCELHGANSFQCNLVTSARFASERRIRHALNLTSKAPLQSRHVCTRFGRDVYMVSDRWTIVSYTN